MRPLGLLGGPLSGTGPSTSPSSPYQNVQTFTSGGTFKVPSGVTSLAVMCIGGGGGGGGNNGLSQNGGGGGSTSFGSYLTAFGGSAGIDGGYGGNVSGSVGSIQYDGTSGTLASGGGLASSTGTVWGKAGSGIYGGGSGGAGGVLLAIVPVTPGTAISVTIGSGGSSYGIAAGAGAVVVRY